MESAGKGVTLLAGRDGAEPGYACYVTASWEIQTVVAAAATVFEIVLQVDALCLAPPNRRR